MLGIAFEAHFLEFLITHGPAIFIWLSEDIEDAVKLVDIISAWKQRISKVQLYNNTS